MTKAFNYSDVKTEFQQRGCILLETEYRNSLTPMSYICSCGNKAKIRLSCLKSGRKCVKCKSRKLREIKTFSLEEVQLFFAKEGCTLLEETYTNANTKLKYICTCNEIKYIRFSHFKNGVRCRKCGGQKIRNPDRNYIELRRRTYNFISNILYVTYNGKLSDSNAQFHLGYTTKDLVSRIQNHDNWPKMQNIKWHIDHIFPVSAFVKRGITDPKIINSLDNLQPLSAKDNLFKRSKHDKVAFENYLSTKI